MPKRGMGPIRRRQLVDAAITVIHEEGFAHATVARIARRAGVSSGIVHHYFADKEDLLFATMLALLSDLRADAAARLSAARSPLGRLYAIIDASFGERQFEERVFSAWLALYGSARLSPRLQRIVHVYHRRLRSNLMHDLRKLLDGERAAEIAEGVAAMIDGLWLRYALAGKPEDPLRPRTMSRDYVRATLGAFSESSRRRRPCKPKLRGRGT